MVIRVSFLTLFASGSTRQASDYVSLHKNQQINEQEDFICELETSRKSELFQKLELIWTNYLDLDLIWVLDSVELLDFDFDLGSNLESDNISNGNGSVVIIFLIILPPIDFPPYKRVLLGRCSGMIMKWSFKSLPDWSRANLQYRVRKWRNVFPPIKSWTRTVFIPVSRSWN